MSTVQIPSSQSAPRPAVRPASNEPPPSGEGGDFAQLMALQAPAEPPPQDQRPEEARQARTRQSARPPLRPAQAEARRDTPDVAPPSRKGAEAPRPVDDDTPPLDPALVQWLQALHRPEATAEAPAAPEGSAVAGTPRKQHGLSLARPAPGPGEAADASGIVTARTGHGPHAPRGADKAAREAAQPEPSAAERSAEEAPVAAAPLAGDAAPAAASRGFALPAGFEPVSASAPDVTAPVVADTPVLAVPMPVPLESPEFAQAFGLEISTLARDGIQQAELHLNPAEMGPVSVQIALDGERARIDFGAQAAATRAAIEASLPELAAALRDAGLTLAGGGVSQHAGARDDGRREGQADAGRGGSQPLADTVSAAPGRAPMRSRAGPGGVDLYA